MTQKAIILGERLEKPSVELATRYIDKFDKEQGLNETAVNNAFLLDNSEANILIKVVLLNNRYSAGLNDNEASEEKGKRMPNVLQVTKKIFSYENDNKFEECKNRDDVIGIVKSFSDFGESFKRPFSFITKYCSFRLKDIDVPIADGYVKGLLYYFNELYQFYGKKFKQDYLYEYKYFCEVYDSFKKEYLNGLSTKNIDKYLWLYAKTKEKELKKEFNTDFLISIYPNAPTTMNKKESFLTEIALT